MDKSAYQYMNQHITILGWLYIVSSILIGVIGFVVAPIMAGSALLSGDGEAFILMSIFGTAMAAFMLLLAAPGLVAGIGLLKRKSWARVLTIVLGILNLTNFPIGTALGVYTLFVLLQSDAGDIFATPSLA